MTRAVLVSTGTANIASVRAAFLREGIDLTDATDAASIAKAERVVVPGVGAFAAAMANLRERGLVDALRARVHARKPTFGICLGMQVFGEASDESPGIAGIGAFSGRFQVFAPTLGVRVPQLGWNELDPPTESTHCERGHVFFAHSYYLETTPTGFVGTHTTYGIRYVAALENGGVLFCQFHPELSSHVGRRIIQRWLSA